MERKRGAVGRGDRLDKSGEVTGMLCRLELDNFKTFNGFHIEINPLTIIVGNNASGKSTLLQVLDFMFTSVQEDFSGILNRRGWNAADLRSKCREKVSSRMVLAAEFHLKQKEKDYFLRWEMVLQYAVQKNMLTLLHEVVTDKESGRVYIEYQDAGVFLYKKDQEQIRFPRISGTSSVLKVLVDIGYEEKDYPELVALKRFLLGIRSFELLTPEQMRASSRGKSKSLSAYGRNLPSFLKSMTEEQRRRFLEKLHELLEERIENVTAETRGKPGWTYVNITEKYQNQRYTVSSRHLSDGTLRLLAFLGVSEGDDGSLFLWDEIENGINSSYAEKLMDIFYEMCIAGRQFMATTHSVVFLDFVKKEDIVYFYREESQGNTKAVRIFELPELEEKLEYMYPGEIIYNLDNQEIINICLKHLK